MTARKHMWIELCFAAAILTLAAHVFDSFIPSWMAVAHTIGFIYGGWLRGKSLDERLVNIDAKIAVENARAAKLDAEAARLEAEAAVSYAERALNRCPQCRKGN